MTYFGFTQYPVLYKSIISEDPGKFEIKIYEGNNKL